MAEIHDLIRAGDVEGLEELLQAHAYARTLANEPDKYGNTPLTTAIDCPAPDPEIVRLLLKHGAQVWFDATVPQAPLEQDEVIEILKGVYTELPEDFFDEPEPDFFDVTARWIHLGLGKPNEEPLLSLPFGLYRADPFARPGRANPEDMTSPFRLAMIRAGCSAYRARSIFGDEPDFPGCLIPWTYRHKPVWSFQRFGQTLTILPDGRRVFIGGEHEDFYDPDFYIYNDVTIVHLSGLIQIFGYPRDVFEPTDFHTATLVGDHVWILGGLGYREQRKGTIPVYRLDTRTYAIERISTTGDVPPRMHKHEAKLVGDSIVVPGFRLHLPSLVWSSHA